jgi:hypothetical protein
MAGFSTALSAIAPCGEAIWSHTMRGGVAFRLLAASWRSKRDGATRRRDPVYLFLDVRMDDPKAGHSRVRDVNRTD